MAEADKQNSTPPEEVPIRDAATVIMLRDGAQGLETFMLRRNKRNVFGPGAYVFPGGAVDRADAGPTLRALCDGLDDGEASRRLGIDGGGLAFWVAAIRECFEEAGLLLATQGDGRPVSPARDFRSQRQALNAGSLAMADFCRDQNLRLPLQDIVYYGHWITPVGEPRRFSTRFFACSTPHG
ncbi:MAG: NUDIX domain-containing protein, partial [Nitrosospira sp.]|nr:NUDIX domain-containing protein [Nitrosospira sp.]